MMSASRFLLRQTRYHHSALTLLELLAVMTVIAILGVLLFPVLQSVREKPESIICMQNLRSLHASLGAYISDKGHWPQIPPGIGDDDARARWWVEELKPYDAPLKVWHCPSLVREMGEGTINSEEVPSLHYVPGHFDKHRFSPYRWSTQPWVIELYDHGDGNFILFPDGHIDTLNNVYERATGKKLPGK